MPPPADLRADIEPPEEVTTEGVKGFLAGAFRVRTPTLAQRIELTRSVVRIRLHPRAHDLDPPPSLHIRKQCRPATTTSARFTTASTKITPLHKRILPRALSPQTPRRLLGVDIPDSSGIPRPHSAVQSVFADRGDDVGRVRVGGETGGGIY